MQIRADSWTMQPFPKTSDYTFSPALPFRNDSANDFFQNFRLGVGGGCASRFTPQAAYWCSEGSQGGGPGPYSAPVGLVASNASTSLPHTPYKGDMSRATVHSWRADRWFSWVFAVDSADFDASTGTTSFNFSLTKGGNQGSRGGNAGQEFMVENVMDELDSPAEFFYDLTAKKLYLWYNSTTGGTPPPANSVVVTQATEIINAVGTPAAPVVGVSFLGLGFRDTAPNYLGPHGTPSGGDWAVGRSAALFFEGVEDIVVDGCFLTTLDTNAIFLSGYVRGASITRNEFFSIGETVISSWGYTDGSPVPGMGFDATAGNQPRGSIVALNYAHEIGLWTKQNSFVFQSESFNNTYTANIAFNGPRAGINFDDGMGGGSSITHNVLANFCRESSDHGPFNSWNRQVYIWDTASGPTTMKLNDTIAYNFILANYHSSMAIDNDDGSAYFNTHHNVLWSASAGAAYGGNSLKTDYGGHSNFHHDNLDLFWSAGYVISPAIAGKNDAYYNNYLYQANDGDYGNPAGCDVFGQGPTATISYNNTVWTPTGKTTECGMTLAAFQAKGGDQGTKALPYPTDATVLSIARELMGL